MKRALIDPRYNNRVCQVVNTGNDFYVAPPLAFVDCPDDTTTAHTYNGAVFTAPQAETLGQAKLRKGGQLRAVVVHQLVTSEATATAIISHARSIRDAIVAANNISAVDAIDVNAGWP